MNLPETACHLPRVRVAADRETRTVVGLGARRCLAMRVIPIRGQLTILAKQAKLFDGMRDC